jgi:hypothetical protein
MEDYEMILQNQKKKNIMSTMELEAQKAYLAREILTTTDEHMINNMKVFLNNYNATQSLKKNCH